MQLTFQLTPAEIQEAIKAHAAPDDAALLDSVPKKLKYHSGLTLMFLLAFFLFFIGVSISVGKDQSHTPSSMPTPSLYYPTFVFQILAWFGLVFSILAMRFPIAFEAMIPKRGVPGRDISTSISHSAPTPAPFKQDAAKSETDSLPRFLWVVGLSAFILSKITLDHYFPTTPLSPSAVTPPSSLPVIIKLILPLLPWAAFFIFAFYMFRWQLRRHKKKNPRNSEVLQQPRTVTIDADSLTIEEPQIRHIYRWLAFTSLRETPNLFLLYYSPTSFHILPKRAFATDSDLATFRSLTQSQIPHPTGGFPVQLSSPPNPS